MHDFHRRVDRLHVRLGQRAPAAADRIERRPAERGRKFRLQHGVDAALGLRRALGEHRLDRQGAERQADPAVADPVIERLGDFETAAAHVADGPDRAEETGDHAQCGESRLLGSAQDADVQTGLGGDGGDERRPVGGAPNRFGARHVDLGDAHRVGDGAKAARRLNRPAKPLRRDGAGLGEAVAEAAQRLLVEARQRRAAELVVDHEPHRIRADVDDRIGRPDGASGALGIEIERPRHGAPRVGAILGHRAPFLAFAPIMRDDE